MQSRAGGVYNVDDKSTHYVVSKLCSSTDKHSEGEPREVGYTFRDVGS